MKLGDRVRLLGSPRVGVIDSITPITFYVEWIGESYAPRSCFHFGAENLVEPVEEPCTLCKRMLRFDESPCWFCGTSKDIKS